MVILEHLAKRARLDMPNNTTPFLKLLCRPFDEPITRSNLEHCFTSKLLQKLPAEPCLCRSLEDYLVPKCSEALYNVPRLSAIVSTILSKSFTECVGQEERTTDGINDHILDMITFFSQYIATPSLRWNRNGIIKDTSTITENKARLDITVYSNDLLVMIGEEKDVKGKLLITAEQLDDYFQFWNPLAFRNLPFVIAFAAGCTSLQFYYHYVDDTTGLKPRREAIGERLMLESVNRGFNYRALQYTINFIRVLQTLSQDQYIEASILKLFDEVKRSNGSVIIFPENIIKKINKSSIVNLKFHKEFYENTLPYLGPIRVLDYKVSSYLMIVKLTPVGTTVIPKREPSCEMLYEKLHKMNVVHRDICWDNVLNSRMLIDFEEAAPLGGLRCRAPEFKSGRDLCSAAGDIWMVGNLFKHSRIYNHIPLSSSAQKFRKKLMNENPNSRPTADDALKDGWFNLQEEQLSIMQTLTFKHPILNALMYNYVIKEFQYQK
ncbi:hypothetical protein G9A89_006967 [Geosiphon pyriformis]|nr:hypothetical protein G9A89_006967 [Geosiphon pyriformis]